MVKTYDDPRSSRQGRDRRLSKNHKIALGCGVAIALIATLMIALGNPPPPTAYELIWVAEKTTRAPGTMPTAIKDRIKELGNEGGGRLTVYAAGDRTERIGSVDLDVTQDGDRVTDANRRAAAIDRRIATLTKKLADTPVGDRGFSLYQALRVGADEAARSGAPVEVWLSTTVLSASTDPLSLPTLTDNEAEPSQAVAELLKGSLHDLDLHQVNLHLVLLNPVGDNQQPLNPRSESWRTTFITNLCKELGAQVSDPLRDSTTVRAWLNSSEVPAIVPMVDKTPVQPKQVPVAKGDPPPSPRIDNAAFHPDSAILVDPGAVSRAVSQVVAAYQQNPGHFRVRVTGYCARIGAPEGARTLSAERASAISTLLQAQGVRQSDIEARGVGFDERADQTQDPQSPAQRVVIIQLVANT
jgi:outer membrane protein OmpA-like peptidoglycan-associated protein